MPLNLVHRLKDRTTSAADIRDQWNLDALIAAAERDELPEPHRRRLVTQLAPYLMKTNPGAKTAIPWDLQDTIRLIARLIRILLLGYTTEEIDAMCQRVPVARMEDRAEPPHRLLIARIDEILSQREPHLRAS